MAEKKGRLGVVIYGLGRAGQIHISEYYLLVLMNALPRDLHALYSPKSLKKSLGEREGKTHV